MTVVNCIADLQALARRRIPRAMYEFADQGSYDELTYRRNRADLDALRIRGRVLVDVSQQTLRTSVLGEPITMPVAIAPTGLAGLFHANGEILGARAAEAFGIPFCLSTMSVCSIEDVRSAVTKPFWFQIYLMRDRNFNLELIQRAQAAQCSALVVTVDLPVLGVRRRDAKNGLSIPPRLTLANALDIAGRPAWALKVLFGKRRSFGNVDDLMKRSGGNLNTVSAWIATQFDPSVTWKDIEWIRSVWRGKLIVKGILDADDARAACTAGVDALVVSNHGGRQLDGAASSISVLPQIVDAVKDRCEVLFDGGVQSGQDVLKALALGARTCLLGRTFVYALGAMGEKGVTAALDIIRSELQVSLALAGVTDVQRIDRSSILHS